jgi:hypothetical protein
MTIISNPAQVCVEHALEFWTGLLVYGAKDHSDLCVGHERLCTCRSCATLKARESASHRNRDRLTRRRETGSILRFAAPRNADEHEAGTIGSLPASAIRAHP